MKRISHEAAGDNAPKVANDRAKEGLGVLCFFFKSDILRGVCI